jgi:PPOX class probable F420-dependent enzyme
MAAHIDGRSRELIEQPNFCFVATRRTDGTPQVNPVWVDVQDDHVLLNSAKGRRWPANAARDPQLVLTIPNWENPYEYVSIRGHVAEITEDGADAHIDALAKKYLGVDEYPSRRPGERRIIVRVEPDRVTHVGG